jgi:hypothetical protein
MLMPASLDHPAVQTNDKSAIFGADAILLPVLVVAGLGIWAELVSWHRPCIFNSVCHWTRSGLAEQFEPEVVEGVTEGADS